jgi:hypothetical protein
LRNVANFALSEATENFFLFQARRFSTWHEQSKAMTASSHPITSNNWHINKVNDRSDVYHYVTMCSRNYDGRRLGNQLFNLAAMLYVARRTGYQVALPATLRLNGVGWKWLIDQWFEVQVPVIKLTNVEINGTSAVNK